MSPRDELHRQIRYELSAHPAILRLYEAEGEAGATDKEAISYLLLWSGALQRALFTLADEVDALKLLENDS